MHKLTAERSNADDKGRNETKNENMPSKSLRNLPPGDRDSHESIAIKYVK